ncbi:MAG: DUF739 family protein [Desulfovibrionales bacterium]|jgi:hypothetical protein|nr:DUF739 family protein [Desulfovibrionales bacterium]
MEVTFDYSKLRGRIREKYGTEGNFADSLGISRVSLSKRLNNLLDFNRIEMMRACDLLEISAQEMPRYFFTKEVQKDEPA